MEPFSPEAILVYLAAFSVLVLFLTVLAATLAIVAAFQASRERRAIERLLDSKPDAQ